MRGEEIQVLEHNSLYHLAIVKNGVFTHVMIKEVLKETCVHNNNIQTLNMIYIINLNYSLNETAS